MNAAASCTCTICSLQDACITFERLWHRSAAFVHLRWYLLPHQVDTASISFKMRTLCLGFTQYQPVIFCIEFQTLSWNPGFGEFLVINSTVDLWNSIIYAVLNGHNVRSSGLLKGFERLLAVFTVVLLYLLAVFTVRLWSLVNELH